MTHLPTADLLETIVAATRQIVRVREAREPMHALSRRADARAARPGRFTAALEATGINVIAECKRRSPSRGVLRPDYDAVAIASAYTSGGAAAISVLTEPTFFDGSLEDLAGVCDAVSVPVLRKDFIVSEYQLLEARAAGADAILLIVAALSSRELQSLAARAASLGLDALIEVHNAEELRVALDAGAKVIGVNNRDLRTLAVDVHASEVLIDRMPDSVVAVSESGLKTSRDLVRLHGAGYHAFLIGERFMGQGDPGAALRSLLEETRNDLAAG